MIDTKELSQALGAVQPGEVAELIDRLEEVEKERDDLRAELTDLRSSMTFRTSLIGRIEAERDALQAKIEAMERPGAAIRSIYGAQPAPSVPDVDALAQFIREVDGKHQLGAGALAERIVEWLAAAPEAKPCP